MLSNSGCSDFSVDKGNNSLIFDSIYFSYRDREVLKGVYLDVPKGKVTGLFGQNGSGKSTLLKIGTGLLKQEEGLVIINGKRFYKKNLFVKSGLIGYLHQDSFLPKDIKVKDLVKSLPLSQRELPEADDIIQRILPEKAGNLSGGERRFLEINLVLHSGKEYLLLDEPFTGLSPLIIELVYKKIKQAAASGCGLLLCDHYMNYSVPVSDECYILENGSCFKQIKNN